MPGPKSGTRVFIGRLPHNCRERDLDKFFRNYGRLKEIILKNGYGFVEFDDIRDAEDAVYDLNGRELLGERVTVEHAKGTARRPGGPYQRDYRQQNFHQNRRPVWVESFPLAHILW